MGTLYDASGNKVPNAIIRLYRRDTGALLTETVTGDGTEAQAGEEHYNNVSVLLHCNGTDGSTTVTDSGPVGHTISVSGNAHIETDDQRFGTASLYCDGDGDYITLPYHTSFEFGSGDFTVELFVKTSSTKQYGCLIGRDTGTFPLGSWALLLNGNGSGSIQLWCSSYSTNSPLLSSSASAAVNNGSWNHIALVRNGSAFAIFCNGTSVASATWSGTIATLGVSLRVCSEQGYARDIAASVDEIRITKGVARYTANFTPPDAPFLDYADIPARPLGEFTLSTTYVGEVQRVILDPDGEPLQTDLIDRILLT